MKRMTWSLCGAMVLGMSAVSFSADPPRVKVEVQKQEVAPPATARTDANVDSAHTIRSSELMGTDVVLQDGDSLGQIADLVIDSSNGHVTHVVVQTEENYRAIPFRTLAMYQGEEAHDHYFILGMERDRFLEAPAITHQEWQTFSTPQWRTYAPNVAKFYTNVEPVKPSAVRRAERAADRNIEQGERKAERKLRK